MITRSRHGASIAALLVAGLIGLAPTLTLADTSYGSGSYGSCQYASCSISITSGGSVALGVTPTAGTTCTVASDSVSVTTDSSTGYTLSLGDTDTVNQLTGTGGGSIAAVTGSAAAPTTLTAGRWGYRIDGFAGFGAGPTSAQTSSASPSVAFAPVQPSSAAQDTIATTTAAADPAVTTPVWYGLCADTTTPSDIYTDSVTYTAVTN